jgi:hypothetical protein
MFNNFFRKSPGLWDIVEKYGRSRQATDDNIIRRMRFACWINKAIDTHSEYVIFIAFPQQQWLLERASVLRYTYIACLVIYVRSYAPAANFPTNYSLTESQIKLQDLRFSRQLQSPVIWRRVDWYMGTNSSEEIAASIFWAVQEKCLWKKILSTSPAGFKLINCSPPPPHWRNSP